MKYSKHKLRQHYKVWLGKYTLYLLGDSPDKPYLCYDSEFEKFFVSNNFENLDAFNLTYESLIRYHDLRLSDMEKILKFLLP